MAADGDINSYCSSVQSLNRTCKHTVANRTAAHGPKLSRLLLGDMEISDIMIPHAGRTDGARGFWEQTEKQRQLWGAPVTWMILWRAAGEAAPDTPMSSDLSKASIRSC